jgi:hypothetical protein
MKRPILAIGLVLIIFVAVAGIAYLFRTQLDFNKGWYRPEPEDMKLKISFKGRSLHDWAEDLKSKDVEVRRKSAEALTEVPFQHGKYLLATLKEAIDDSDSLTSARAASALGRILPRAGIPAPPETVISTTRLLELTQILKDPDPSVRIAGAEALASFGPRLKAAGPALAELAKNDQDENVRKAAASALEQVSPASAKPSPGSKAEKSNSKVLRPGCAPAMLALR